MDLRGELASFHTFYWVSFVLPSPFPFILSILLKHKSDHNTLQSQVSGCHLLAFWIKIKSFVEAQAPSWLASAYLLHLFFCCSLH